MRNATTAEDLLLVEEVAREMRVPVTTVRWWIRTGKLPASRPGRRLVVRRSDLEALLSAKSVKPKLRDASAARLRFVPSELDRKRADEALKRRGP
jgi:excisionase family DNA binding protein